ncbi:MAG: response regulator transcription factor [Bacteroidota bacterium]
MLIQIVDDNHHMRQTIRSVLAGLHPTFIESGSGEEGIRQFIEFLPDIVLMDIRMDRMDGISATRMIRRAVPDAQVIIVSQYDDHELRVAAGKAGAAGYVLKDDLLQLPEIILALRS